MGLRTLIAKTFSRWALRNKKMRRELLTSLWAEGSLFFRRFEDHDLIFYPHDVIGAHLCREGSFSRGSVRKISDFLAKHGQPTDGGSIIEIGANIGTHTVYFFRDTACSHVIALEPDPENFEVLTLNVKLNDLSDKVTLMNAGASSEEGTLPFFKDSINRGGSRFGEEHENAIAVDVKTLDAVFKNLPKERQKVCLVWIDVEGHELPVLQGALATIKHNKPPVFVEYTPQDAVENNSELWGILSEHYSHIYDFRNLEKPLTRQRFDQITTQTDLLAISTPDS